MHARELYEKNLKNQISSEIKKKSSQLMIRRWKQRLKPKQKGLK